MIAFLSLCLLLISQATDQQVNIAQKPEQKQYFRLVNLQDVVVLIAEDHSTESERNQPQFRMVQAIHNKEYQIHWTTINFKEFFDLQSKVDSGWRFNQIVAHIDNTQSLIFWRPSQNTQLLGNYDMESSQFQICLSLYMYNADQTQIFDNIFKTSSQIMKILQLNENSSIFIRNITCLGPYYPTQHNSIMNVIEIINGEINIEQFYISSNVLDGFRFISPTVVKLQQILAQLLQQIVKIDVLNSNNKQYLDIIVQFTNITINKINNNLYSQESPALISITGIGFSQIAINGLMIIKVDSIYTEFLHIVTNIRSIDLKNIVFIKNNLNYYSLLIEDNKSNPQTKLRISNMVFNNYYYIQLVKSNIIIDIKDSLIILTNSSSISNSPYVLIQNCEIIHEEDLVYGTLQYQLVNTQFTLNRQKVIKQIYISFDYGLQFAQNLMIARNNYQVLLQNKKQYIYLPTGNYINNFFILDVKSLVYRQQNYSLLFKANDQHIENCDLTIFVGESVYQNVLFNMTNNLLNDTRLVMKPGTIVSFHTKCIDNKNDTIHLQFMAKTMNCQIGEILVDNMCQICDIRLEQYSVQRNSVKCLSIDKKRMLKVNKGLIFLKEGFWRPVISNNLIETCQQNTNCLGGFVFGNQLYATGYIGAICSECDLFKEINGVSHYQNQWQICNKCDIDSLNFLSQILSFIISALLIYLSVITYRKLVRQNALMAAISKLHQRIIRYQHDIIGVYMTFLLDYIQNLFNVSRNQVLALMPFNINIDFITKTSFSFINMIDCMINQYFDSRYWIYIRLTFIFASIPMQLLHQFCVIISYIQAIRLSYMIYCQLINLIWQQQQKIHQKFCFRIYNFTIIL